MAFIKAISDSKEAMREFRKCKSGQLVYSTKNEELVIELVKNVGRREDNNIAIIKKLHCFF